MPLWRIVEHPVKLGDELDGYVVAELRQDLSVTAKMRRHALESSPRHDHPAIQQMWAEEEALALLDQPVTWVRLVKSA